ncbi:MAG: protocatechuate 3,4-dioxygenase subunit alpha [Pseudomonadota bacterium]
MQHDRELAESPSQTAGPYVHIGCMPLHAGIKGIYEHDLHEINAIKGDQRLEISVFDGAENAVTDAILEIWIADPAFWSRCAFDEESGFYRLNFPKPVQRLESGNLISAPHISVFLAARGINIGLNTRIYFPQENNEIDHVLQRIDVDRRATLIAEKTNSAYRFDIHLQGEMETVFFDI